MLENNQEITLQWFPGHMAKTRRLITANCKLVDIVVEVVDARIPRSSRNPELLHLIGGKPFLTLFNKSDMADGGVTDRWISHYKKQGITALKIDCKSGNGVGAILPAIRTKLKDKMERMAAKGAKGMPIRVMVVGIPNVGKSSVINRLSGGKRAKVEDRPGVTRGKQWITLPGGIELLDTPGVLWPKFEDQNVGKKLAFTGAIRDQIMDVEWLAMKLLEFLAENYPQAVQSRYKVDVTAYEDSFTALEAIGRARGMLVPGGQVDTLRAATMLLDEFRGGKLGRLSLERPEDFNEPV